MFETRQTAPRFQTLVAALLFTASWAGLATAQSAAVSSDQWRAVGDSRPANSQPADASTDSSTWKLPNGQSTNSDSASDGANPLRKNTKPQPSQQSAQQFREPRAFQAPTNAKPLSSSQSATSNSRPAPQSRSTSSTEAAKPAHVAAQAYMPPRVQPNRGPATNQQRPANQPGVWSMGTSETKSKSTPDFWQTINVAFQGQPPQSQSRLKKQPSESLPMPGFSDDMQDPVMRQPSGPDAFRQPVAGPYMNPYGEPGMCCDESGCANGCNNGCGGDVFEPGCGCPCGEPCCACEQGCGCQSDGCKKEVFCVGPGDDESCHIVQIRWPKWQEVMVFGGVQGFKGPYDQDRDSGNFGVNEGFNIGAKVPYAEMGYQYGYRTTQNQLNGDEATDTENQFLQQFVTAGLFHRATQGLQFGVAWDALIDERHRAERFHQLRTELSVVGCGCHEFGFAGTIGLNRRGFDNDDDEEIIFQASDQYVAFYRMHGCNGGEGRIYAGANNDSDGIVGSDMLLPIGDRFSIQAGFAYLIPNAKVGEEGASQEAWNIGLGLVWHWDGQARKCFNNCYRPLFDVANNGTLIVDQQRIKD